AAGATWRRGWNRWRAAPTAVASKAAAQSNPGSRPGSRSSSIASRNNGGTSWPTRRSPSGRATPPHAQCRSNRRRRGRRPRRPRQRGGAVAPPKEPANPGAGERRAFKVTSKQEGPAEGDGGAKGAADTQLKQHLRDDAEAQAKPGAAPAAPTEAKREALRREVVTQIVLSPRIASELEDRSKGRTDQKPFDLQAVAQGLRLQALTAVPLRAADALQVL